MTERRHGHVEAFRLMVYATADGAEREVIWNSRDGVTPFIVRSRTGREMSHVPPWDMDKYDPDHRPRVGDRVFVDLTIERARERMREYVQRYWGDRQLGLPERYASQALAVEALALGHMQEGGGVEPPPDIVEVTREMAVERGWLNEVEAALDLAAEALKPGPHAHSDFVKRIGDVAATVAGNLGVSMAEARRGVARILEGRLPPEMAAATRRFASMADARGVTVSDARGRAIGTAVIEGDRVVARVDDPDALRALDLGVGSPVSVGYRVDGEPSRVDDGPGWRIAARCCEVIARCCRGPRVGDAAALETIAGELVVLMVALGIRAGDLREAARAKDALWSELNRAAGRDDTVDARREAMRAIRDAGG